jgi:hypothetical protein
MKTSVEINGYTISIEETDGVISVNAIKEDEVIEEFTIEMEESQGTEDSDDIKGFEDYEEEGDFEGGEGQFEDDEDKFEDESDEDDESNEAPALESFQSFINKKK